MSISQYQIKTDVMVLRWWDASLNVDEKKWSEVAKNTAFLALNKNVPVYM